MPLLIRRSPAVSSSRCWRRSDHSISSAGSSREVRTSGVVRRTSPCIGYYDAVMGLLLMRQLKIDVLSALEVTDKLEFIGLKARGILSPSGRHIHSEVVERVTRQRGGRNHSYKPKRNLNPDVGRGGRKRCNILRPHFLPPTPDVGALIVLFVYEGFRRCAAPPPRYGYAARSAGSNRRSLSLAN